MRKLSKILAVALALCLLCGAVVMSVGATSDNFTVANASGWQTQYDDALVLPEGLSVPADANGLTTTVRHGYDFEDRDSGLGISFLGHGCFWHQQTA